MCTYKSVTTAFCTWVIFSLACIAALCTVCPTFGVPSQHHHTTIVDVLDRKCGWVNNRLQIEQYYKLASNETAVYLCRPAESCGQDCNAPAPNNTVCVSGWYGCYPRIVEEDVYTGRTVCLSLIVINLVVVAIPSFCLMFLGVTFAANYFRMRQYEALE